MIKDILKKASEMDASDVHLNTYNPPAFRIDGEIQRIGDEPLTAESIMECINTVTNDLEKEMYKNGEDIDSSYEDEDGNRFRINIFTQRKSPAMVVRLLNTHIPTLEEYNLPRVLAELAELPRGMVLVTGPTGSGKRLRVDTPIKTPTGMVPIGELKVGDQVYDSKNKVCNVTDVSEIEGKPELYALEFTDGQVVYADAEHQWIVSTDELRSNQSKHEVILNDERVSFTERMLESKYEHLIVYTTNEIIKSTQNSFAIPKVNFTGWNYIASITKVDEHSEEYGPARCISVDSDDHSYQCADGIITHNSTTLAAMINHINMNKKKHILTLEDPIEYIHEQKQSILNQREIHKDSKSFDDSLKSALREDPDIILIGEMRDIETIKLAITAAETGHLVLSTLHTIGAPDTINRIIDTFPADQQSQVRAQLSMSLKGVVSQVLIPKIGGGRIAAHEILISNDAIANNIRQNAIQNISSSMLSGKGQGMQLLDHKLAELVREGKIERDKAREFVKDKEQFDRLMR